MAMEVTLSIIKPDAVQAGAAGHILQAFLDAGLSVRAMKLVRLTTEQARSFYAVHAERPFYDDLVAFMTEGPVVVSALEADDAVRRYRELIGATNPADAAEGTVRQRFGTNVERNAVHGSDSPENGIIETDFFFSKTERV
jgi:nucleoside-diphosphate kinase